MFFCLFFPQGHLYGRVAFTVQQLLLHAGPACPAIRHSVGGAHFHIHTHCHCGVGQAATGRGRKFAWPTNGQIKAKGKWERIFFFICIIELASYIYWSFFLRVPLRNIFLIKCIYLKMVCAHSFECERVDVRIWFWRFVKYFEARFWIYFSWCSYV